MSNKKTNPEGEGEETSIDIADSLTAEKAQMDTPLVAQEEIVPEEISYYPCICPCNCGRDSILSTKISEVLSHHARCEECGEPTHMKSNSIVDKDPTRKASRFITLLHEITPEESAASKEANANVKKEIWDAQWASWEASLPEKFRGANNIDHPMVKECLARLKEKKPGVASLAFVGDTGVGKTYSSISYANAAIKMGYFKPSEVLFGSESELLAAAANAKFADVETAFKKLTSRHYKMIIIDDVGRGTYLRDDMRPKVWSLILDKLYSENRVIVVTSNLSNTGLTEHIGEGAMDRLRAMVGYQVAILKDPKRRKVTEETLASMGKDESTQEVKE